ncbi:MAG: hypothetical protein JWQ79_5, partial [Mucilaginibacter sp.]|nr:hypothetical protein [Mucilaginibacter sp.]
MSLSIRIRTILSIICLVAVYTAEAGIQTVGIDTNSTALDNLKIVYFG